MGLIYIPFKSPNHPGYYYQHPHSTNEETEVQRLSYLLTATWVLSDRAINLILDETINLLLLNCCGMQVQMTYDNKANQGKAICFISCYCFCGSGLTKLQSFEGGGLELHTSVH